jgi:nucleotide-binding universal stress UspA family protein
MKDLLVSADGGAGDAVRIDVAARLAQRRDGRLTGLFVVPPSRLPGYIEAEIPAAVRARREEMIAEEVDASRRLFEDAARRHGVLDHCEWRVVNGDPTETATLHGRYADLVVAGQPEPGRRGDGEPARVEDLLFDCGRPVLMVPYAGRFDTVGERIVVGWNATREAARAVGDGLPLLIAARKVVVMSVNPQRAGANGLGDAPGADIARHLSRHGCRVEAAQVSTDQVDPGEAMLNVVSDEAADLVVMGAYGRSRMREMILGGMTRFMLRHATVPVLLSH